MSTGSTESRKPLLSIVVPVYCEAEVLPEFYSRTKSVLQALAPKYEHEIIFVNDGSTDESLEILRRFAESDATVRVVDFSRNFGHQVAITAGVDNSRGDAVIIIDSDLQDPPEVIPEMLAKWEEGYKVVYGVRASREGESAFKLLTASIFYRLLRWLSDVEIPLDSGDFRLLDRDVAVALGRMRERARYVRGMISWLGFRQCGIPYHRDKRYAGKTKYTLSKMLRLAADGITNFSEKPLYLAGYGGLIITLISSLMILWVLISKLVHPATVVRGWTSLLLAVLFLGGIQMIFIGLLGQYVARIFAETKGRPLYVIDAKYGFSEEREDE